ncbi:MAG: flagellar basal-body rod protein FlgG [Verrucomicrobia bacterium]|nr:flagellar basal-body rod protein FlgG [Verrucomicrobiota bacterium]
MLRSLMASASGMEAQQSNIDNIANNLANVNTTAFKKSQIEFQDMMYQTNRAAGAATASGGQIPTGIQVGHGTRVAATATLFSQGAMQQTGVPLDVAIEGPGFFEVTLPDGTAAFTRDGAFKLNSTGNVVTSDGLTVKGLDSMDPATQTITIGSDGSISVGVKGGIEKKTPITLARFANPSGLRSMGRNLYAETDASGKAETGGTPGQNGFGTLAQGYIEMSNVEVVQEMVNMITAQRAYEMNSKTIQASDEMMGLANNLKR